MESDLASTLRSISLVDCCSRCFRFSNDIFVGWICCWGCCLFCKLSCGYCGWYWHSCFKIWAYDHCDGSLGAVV